MTTKLPGGMALFATRDTVSVVVLAAFAYTKEMLVALKLNTDPSPRDEKLKGRQAKGLAGVAWRPAGHVGLHRQLVGSAAVQARTSPAITDPMTQPSGTSSKLDA